MVNDPSPENTEEVSKQENEEQDQQHEGDDDTDSPAGNDVLSTRDVPSGNL